MLFTSHARSTRLLLTAAAAGLLAGTSHAANPQIGQQGDSYYIPEGYFSMAIPAVGTQEQQLMMAEAVLAYQSFFEMVLADFEAQCSFFFNEVSGLVASGAEAIDVYDLAVARETAVQNLDVQYRSDLADAVSTYFGPVEDSGAPAELVSAAFGPAFVAVGTIQVERDYWLVEISGLREQSRPTPRVEDPVGDPKDEEPVPEPQPEPQPEPPLPAVNPAPNPAPPAVAPPPAADSGNAQDVPLTRSEQRRLERERKRAEREERKRQKALERAQKKAEREALKEQKRLEREERKRQKALERAQKKAEREALKEQKRLEREERNRQKALERAQKKAEREALREQKRLEREERRRQRELERQQRQQENE